MLAFFRFVFFHRNWYSVLPLSSTQALSMNTLLITARPLHFLQINVDLPDNIYNVPFGCNLYRGNNVTIHTNL